MNNENRKKIEQFWNGHPLNDMSWLKMLQPCRHDSIGMVGFERWRCDKCQKIDTYEALRNNKSV